jgi:hypothetical protein
MSQQLESRSCVMLSKSVCGCDIRQVDVNSFMFSISDIYTNRKTSQLPQEANLERGVVLQHAHPAVLPVTLPWSHVSAKSWQNA